MAAGDSLWGNVVLAMHMDDAGLTDATGKTVTLANGNVSRSGLQYAPLTGNAYSALFESTGRLNLAQNAGFDFGSGDFTVEFWARPTTSVSYAHIVGIGVYGNASWTVQLQNLVPHLKYDNVNGTNLLTAAIGPTLALNTWSHVAAVRSGTTWTVYTNGVAGTPITLSVTPRTATVGPTIGSSDNNYHFVGNLDDIRITKGVARYTSGFTPPATPFLTGLPSESILMDAALPSLSAVAIGGGSIDITLAPLSARIHSGEKLSVSLPSLTARAQGHDSTGEQAANVALPRLSATARSGATAKLSLPSLSSQSTGTVTIASSASISLPSLSASANATASETGGANITLPSMGGKSYAGALCSITIGKITAQATGTTGSIGGAQITLPLFQATAIGTADNHGFANITLPSLGMHGGGNGAAVHLPSLQLTAIGSAVVTATYEAYAVNLGHRNPQATTDEVTRYTNFPFTHVVRYQNSYYGANSTGLYLLEGTTDEATPIPWSFKTGITDFDDAKQKTVAAAYFGGSMPPATTVTLFEGDKVGVPYAQTTPRGADLQNYRETFARGVKGRYYALGLSGTGDIELDDLDFEIKQLTRRI